MTREFVVRVPEAEGVLPAFVLGKARAQSTGMRTPAAAIRAVSVAALARVRAEVAQGRNFRERPHLLRIANADLTEAEREELKAWSAPVRRLRTVVLLLDGSRSRRSGLPRV